MMKKTALLIALIACFFLLSGFSINVGDGIDRSLPIKYPNARANIDKVYVCLEKGFAYHNSTFCSIEEQLLSLNNDDFIEITEYEAILRGFFECPDCSNRAEDSDIIDVENAISDVEYDVEDIYEGLVALINALFQ